MGIGEHDGEGARHVCAERLVFAYSPRFSFCSLVVFIILLLVYGRKVQVKLETILQVLSHTNTRSWCTYTQRERERERQLMYTWTIAKILLKASQHAQDVRVALAADTRARNVQAQTQKDSEVYRNINAILFAFSAYFFPVGPGWLCYSPHLTQQ